MPSAARRPPPQRPRIAPERWPEIVARARYESLRELAVAYGVSHETIRTILRKSTALPALLPAD